jgi:hypothetical protein
MQAAVWLWTQQMFVPVQVAPPHGTLGDGLAHTLNPYEFVMHIRPAVAQSLPGWQTSRPSQEPAGAQAWSFPSRCLQQMSPLAQSNESSHQ